MIPTLVSVGGRGAVFLAAVASVTAVLAPAPAAPATGAHAAVTLVPVHEVGVVGAAPTVTHPATCSQQRELAFSQNPPIIPTAACLTATSSPSAGVHQLTQFGVDGLPGLFQHPDKVPSLPQVARREEGVSGAFVSTAGRASNTVHVILGGVGIVVVDDELDIFNILWVKNNQHYSTTTFSSAHYVLWIRTISLC